MLPNVRSARLGEARLERRIAAVRVVEALRLHAADRGGELPGSLDQLQAVPIPLDPMTGKAFEYGRDGATAVLTGVSAQPSLRLIYKITIRP